MTLSCGRHFHLILVHFHLTRKRIAIFHPSSMILKSSSLG
ncbi:unnamed protein product [Amoebophrya sp. A25]|nr:unnamed protein product [Amoebophrya sp. A25]|eukprot:GSA25T00005342001.1